jgi:hypothetical protein
VTVDHKNQVLRCPKCGDERSIPYAVSKNGERLAIFAQTASNEHTCRRKPVQRESTVERNTSLTPEERWDEAVREYNRSLSLSQMSVS